MRCLSEENCKSGAEGQVEHSGRIRNLQCNGLRDTTTLSREEYEIRGPVHRDCQKTLTMYILAAVMP